MSPRKPTPPTRPNLLLRHPTAAFALLSLGCVLLLYSQSFSSPFLYDDLDGIVHNPNLTTLSHLTHRFLLAPVSFTNEFRATAGSTWRPLFWLSLALDRRLFGLDPIAFHATNLLLHWLDGLLLFTLLRRLPLSSRTLSSRPKRNGVPREQARLGGSAAQRPASPPPTPSPTLAAIAALLWLILPINSEAVAWISGRAYPLCLLFLLLSLHAALTWLRSTRPLALLAAALSGLLALLANESGLLLIPATLLLLTATPPTPQLLSSRPKRSRGPQGATAPWGGSEAEGPASLPQPPTTPPLSSRPKRSRGPQGAPAPWGGSAAEGTASPPQKRTALLLTTLFATDTLFLTLRHLTHATTGRGAPALWSIGPAFLKYLAWALFPLHMSVERSTSTPPNIPSAAALVATVALLAYVAITFLLRKRLPIATTGLLLFAGAILPFCGLVPLYQGMAERFLYVPSIGLALALAALALRYAALTRRASLAALALFALLSALRLHARVADWTDPATLYSSSLAATPLSPGLYFNLAFTAREHGDLDTAREDYQRAIDLQPRYERAYASLGDVEARLNHPTEAAATFRQALALNPGDAPTRTSLAVSLQTLGNLPAAEQEFHRSLALAPNDPTTYTDLAVLLSQENRLDEAIQAFQHAIALNPNDTTAYFDLGVVFQQRGEDDLALPFYRKVLTLKPDDPDTLVNISHLHRQP